MIFWLKYFLSIIPVFSLCLNLIGQSVLFTPEQRIVLDSGINDECSFPLLSNDGTTLFFVKSFSKENIGGEKGGQDIWFSKRLDSAKWSAARNLEQLNNRYNNMVVGIAQDDSTLYLLNTYSSANRWRYGLSTANFINESLWSDPQELDIEFPIGKGFRNFYVSPEENLILLSTQDEMGLGQEDIYIYHKQDTVWVGPILLDSAINSEGSEISPFYSSEWEALFFASNGRGGYGDFDIFMSFREEGKWDKWSPAFNMGSSVNSHSFDAYLSTFSSAETFFVSSKEGKKSSVYTGKLSFVEPDPKQTIDTVNQKEYASDITVSTDIVPNTKTENIPAYYVIQVLAMPECKEPEQGFFKLLENKQITISEGKDGLVRYHFGEYKVFKEAMSSMHKVREIGYSDAFVRPIMKYEEL